MVIILKRTTLTVFKEKIEKILDQDLEITEEELLNELNRLENSDEIYKVTLKWKKLVVELEREPQGVFKTAQTALDILETELADEGYQELTNQLQIIIDNVIYSKKGKAAYEIFESAWGNTYLPDVTKWFSQNKPGEFTLFF